MSKTTYAKRAYIALDKAWSDLRDEWDRGHAAGVPVDAKGMRALLFAIERLEGDIRRLREARQ